MPPSSPPGRARGLRLAGLQERAVRRRVDSNSRGKLNARTDQAGMEDATRKSDAYRSVGRCAAQRRTAGKRPDEDAGEKDQQQEESVGGARSEPDVLVRDLCWVRMNRNNPGGRGAWTQDTGRT